MDYEKKYNDALNLAKSYYGKGCNEFLDTIFPELRESEDERIRRTLVEYFGPKVQLDFVRGVPIQKIRDWLEKQKEHVPKNEKVGIQLPTNSEEITMSGTISKIDESHPDNRIVLADCGGIISIRNFILAINGYKESDRIVVGIRRCKENEVHYPAKHINRDKDPLKSVYPPFKPAEWSEEDEKMVDTIVSVLGQYIDYKAVSGTGSGYATPRYSKEIDWLKSLRPQIIDSAPLYTIEQVDEKVREAQEWKPSKEQMGALNYAYCELFKRGDVDHNILSPLQNLIDTLSKL